MIKLDDFKELVKFANEIADFLQIDTPKIEYNENVVDAERGDYIPEKDEIILAGELDSRDIYFTVAHELRHKWQFLNEYNTYFADYKEIEEINLNGYRMQKAEIDANAFGMIMMIKYFQGTVCFNGYSKEEKRKIIERASELAKEYSIEFPFEGYCKFLGL
jgi:Zn-dependent peptidase ImmA (M78 family)